MEAKYYTPKIEEFHVGFSFEFKHRDYPYSGWIKYDTPEFNWELEDCPIGKKDLSEYRVKYLDESDIVAEGWEKISEGVFSIRNSSNISVIMSLGIGKENWIILEKSSYEGGQEEEYRKFVGTIRNKSELKKVMEMVGIKK